MSQHEENVEILRPLNDAEVLQLMELYKQKYGNHNMHYLLMYQQSKWNKQLAQQADINDEWKGFRKYFYTHRNGDFRQYGTYVCLHYDMLQSVTFNSWQQPAVELFDCLRQTNLIHWQQRPLITNVELEFCQQFKELAAFKGASIERARVCLAHKLPHDEALHLECKSVNTGYAIVPLSVQHAAQVHEIWPNKKEATLQFIEGLIKLNLTLGIVRESDNALVAWIFQNDYGGLGILQVLESVQRNGFGKLLAAHLSHKIAEAEQQQVPVTAWTVVENHKSIALLQKIGYTKNVINEWIQLQ